MSNEPRDVQLGDPELMKPPLAEESVLFDLDQISSYRQDQGATGQCEISVYVSTIHCVQLTMHRWGFLQGTDLDWDRQKTGGEHDE